jgi:hypothetical protein
VVIADRVERRQNVGGELACLLEHGRNHVLGEIAIDAVPHRRAEAGAVLERKRDVGDRRPVGHRWSPGGSGIAVIRPVKRLHAGMFGIRQRPAPNGSVELI